jgi:hypothetical protein
MSLPLLSLLVQEPDVPAVARAALAEAAVAPEPRRQALLEVAARSLYHEAHLDCVDARELVGLGD